MCPAEFCLGFFWGGGVQINEPKDKWKKILQMIFQKNFS